MLKLDSRSCKIGPSINSRTEKHGDEDIPAMDIPLSAIPLSKDELNALLGEPLAWNSFYNERKDGFAEPLLKGIKPIGLEAKYEGAEVTLRLGLNLLEVELLDVKLTKLKLEPTAGGATSLSLTVQCLLEDHAKALYSWMNHDASVEIMTGDPVEAEKSEQPELPLNTFEGDAPPAAAKKRGRPRKESRADLN